MNRRLLAVGAVVMALAVVTGSGAFTSIAADRGATVDVVGDAEMHLGLAPHSGPNGVYAYETVDGLAIDLTAGNPNVGGSGPIYGGTGPGVNVVETIDGVFNVSNQGTQSVRVWIDHDSSSVEFSTTTDDHGSIDGEANAISVAPGATVEVGMVIDSHGAGVGDRLLDGITVNAAAEGADAPDPDPDPDPEPDPESQPSILIGAPQTFVDLPGKAYVVTSPVSGTVGLSVADATLTGEANDDLAGVSSAVAGDINGDGETDYLVGAWGNDEGGSSAGAVYVVYGPVSGTLNLTNADAKLVGPFSGGGAGFSVAGAGDVNGDGFDDVVVGAPFNDTSAGAVYLVYGSASLSGTVDLANADATFQGESALDNAGRRVAGAGDVNGDGFDDLLVGALGRDNVGSNEGAAYLIYGSASLSGTSSLANADATFFGEGDDDEAGHSVAGADVNGDGFADVLVGAPINDNAGGDRAGAAYVVYGGSGASAPAGASNLASADVKIEGDAKDDEAGTAVAGAGDVNGDGFDDVLVGAPNNDAAGSNAGAAYLVYGGASLAGTINLDDADLTITGEAENDHLGDIVTSVAGVGDIDGDGLDDFAVAATDHDTTTLDNAGAVYLFHGGSLSGTVSASTADAKLVGADGDLAGISVSGGQ